MYRCRLDMKGFISYIWHKIRNIQGEKIALFILSITCVCIMWWVMLPHIDAILQVFVVRWIEKLEKTHTIIALYSLIGIGLVTYLYEHVRKMACSSAMVWWWIITLTIAYSFYRDSSLSPFVFWQYKGWTWMNILYVVDGIFACCEISYLIRSYINEKKSKDKEGDLILDNAIDDEQYDFLDYKTRAHELMVSLGAVNLSQHAFSVGIVGEWGIGKSSLLNLFAKEVEREKQILVRFSPRNAKKLDIIQEEFFSAFTDALSKYSYNVHYRIGKYAYALNLHSSTKWLYALIDLFNRKSVAENKKQINDMIRATGKRVFVIIEDLDRLTGQEILEVLKLIDANGNFCNTVFLSAYDKEYVNNVLNHEIGYGKLKQDFTDKFFQYELSLFKHPSTQLYTFITEKMEEWAISQHTEGPSQQTIRNEWRPVYSHIIPYIKTLRQAKRYINLFRMTYSVQKTEVDFADFAIVTLIRYLDVQSYYDLYNREYLTFDGILQSDRTQYKLISDYQNKIGQSQIPNFAQLLWYLFDTNGVRQFDPQYNRLCRAESFDKYFYQTIKGKIYTGKLNTMMNADDETEAIAIMQSIISKSSNAKDSIREFLLTRQPEWIGTPNRLRRYVCMLLYAEGTMADVGLTGTINDMLHTQIVSGYEKLMTKETYIESISYAFATMQQYVPLFIGKYMHIRLKERYKDPSLSEEFCIESFALDQSILAESQRRYDNLYDKTEWSPLESVRFAIRIEQEDETYYKVRAKHLKEMMFAHSDEYADAVISFYEDKSKEPETQVSINYYECITEAMGGQRNFKKWIKSINNKDMSFILWELNYYAQSHFAHSTGLGKIIESPKNNYAQVADIIRKSNARANIRKSKQNK